MRDRLLNDISMLLMSIGIDRELIKNRLILILDKYEITSRCTEVAVVNEDDITKYLKLFLVNKRVSGRTERTIQHYKNELERFFREVQKSPVDITSDDIKLYLAMKEVRDKSSKVYQKNIMRVISSFYQWMVKEEYIIKNPMNKVDEIKIPKVKKDAFSEADIEKMRFAIKDDVRIMCMFELLLSTWCRVSELAQIKLKDISEEKDTVLVHGKGSKDRICYINARAKICLQRYLECRKDNNPYLFAKSIIKANEKGRYVQVECKKKGIAKREWWKAPELVGEGCIDKGSIESWIRRVGRKANVEKAHPHRFRRTGATLALRRGMPIEQVSKLLGHESIETTQIYLDISEQELAQAHKKFV